MVLVESCRGGSVTEQAVEIVERKGIGHPDTICDSIMESVSLALCRVYLEEFGSVLHHNIDKGLLAAGSVELDFGGGRVLRPMELTIGDRATFAAAGRTIPVVDIAQTAAREWIGAHLRHVDPDRHLVCRVVLAPGSAELTDIFLRPGAVLAANDTSAAIGYYPLSPTEEAVLELEGYLNSDQFKNLFPETGEDVKVMGMRRGDDLELTVAMPLLAAAIESERAYFAHKERVLEAMESFAGRFGDFENITMHYNALDRPRRGLGGTYLSLLGTSAEDADSGQVGRGNRVNGVIALNRPLGTEAAAGKNPVSHVGKIYNVLAHQLARIICERLSGGVREAYVMLLSCIGSPIDRPSVVAVQVVLREGCGIDDVRRGIEEICAAELGRIASFCSRLARGEFRVC